MKKYQLAGLDFIIDQNGQPFFIEANSLPGFYKQQLTDDNKIQTLKKLFGRKLIILTPKEKKLLEALTHEEGYTVSQLARMTDIPRPIVSTLLARFMRWELITMTFDQGIARFKTN